MKRHTLILAAAIGIASVFGVGNVCANGPMGKPQGSIPHPTPRVSPPIAHPGQGRRPVPPVTASPPRVHPPVRVAPPGVRLPAPAPTPFPAVAVGGGVLTQGAWVGYHPITGRYSVAFDSPGVGGTGILIQGGYSVIVLGPTTWTGAVSYLKSVGAPGW